MYKIQKDKYQKNRGGYSRILDICCANCSSHIAYYQKDGPGILRRMYIDRIIDFNTDSKELKCPLCKTTVGVSIIYKKEDRPAFRLFVGAVSKKINKKTNLDLT